MSYIIQQECSQKIIQWLLFLSSRESLEAKCIEDPACTSKFIRHASLWGRFGPHSILCPSCMPIMFSLSSPNHENLSLFHLQTHTYTLTFWLILKILKELDFYFYLNLGTLLGFDYKFVNVGYARTGISWVAHSAHAQWTWSGIWYSF